MILLVSKLQLGKLVREPKSLKEAKKLYPTVQLMLLVSKLQLGKLVREAQRLKPAKKLSPTVVILLVSKLQFGRLFNAPW